MAVSEPGLAWSPEQISGRLRLDFLEDPTMRISHEAIYQALLPGSRFERRPPLPYHPDEENHHDDQQGRRPQGRHSPDRRTRS